ncbi:MAG: hypothetical protein ACRDE2_07375, partial [Chitinophagaceae bacterium]
YLDNLAIEIKSELDKLNTTNKKTLILYAVQKFLKEKETKNELISLFEKPAIQRIDVQVLLNKIAQKESGSEKGLSEDNQHSFYTRTYLIATHLYLELDGKEEEYEALTKDINSLKTFVSTQFNASQLSPRIASMKSFSYKDILKSKRNDNAKGQLKPQFRQIIDNPQVFGKDVSQYAEKILNEEFN